MVDRFEKLTLGVTQVYKNIQKIKKEKMNSLGLKGTHVMCLYYLDTAPGGRTAADLCSLCQEDKAGISRSLADLEQHGFIRYDISSDVKKYRAKALLTEEGQKYAARVNKMIIDIVTEAGQNITEEERAIFYRTLSTISDNLQKICEK